MSDSVPRLQMVTWYLPKPLYDAVRELQERLLTPATLQPRWGSVEALAIHFLAVGVQEAHKEVAAKQASARLVKLPGEV